jgi:hypothetical protein
MSLIRSPEQLFHPAANHSLNLEVQAGPCLLGPHAWLTKKSMIEAMLRGGFLRKVFGFFPLLLALCLPVMGQTQQPIRVNCCGMSYTDSKRQVWSADTGYNTGTASSNPVAIKGTTDPKLFQTGRWNGTEGTPLVYSFAVPGGTYRVNLYFAETTLAEERTGGRVFNVKMQDVLVFQNLDIYAEAGANTALVKGVDIAATNGTIKIEFDKGVQNPKVNAIEILQTSGAPEMKLNFAYPDGTPVLGTLNYKMSTSLLNFGGSAPLVNGQAICYLFPSPGVLGLVGTFQVNLNLTDSSGRILWQINLAMDPANVNIGSVQSSSLNVVVQKL